MIEIQGDLWSNFVDAPGITRRIIVRCITTNGTIKQNGEAVMGRGCAREAMVRYPGLPKMLAIHLMANGNMIGGPFRMPDGNMLLTFPVKHHWHEKADPALISASAKELLHLAALPDTVYILPRPGCGNGHLSWDAVRPLISFLPDNVMVISK